MLARLRTLSPSRTAMAFAAGLVLIVAATVGTALFARRHEADRRMSDHTHAVRAALGRFSLHIQELHDPSRRADVEPLLAGELARLRQLTGDHAKQQERLAQAAPLLADAPAHITPLRALLDVMLREERQLQEHRDERARKSLRVIYTTTSASLLTALALFAIAWWRLTAQLRGQRAIVQRLRQSEAQTAALLENGVDAVWAVDLSLRVTASNQRFRTLVTQMSVEGTPRLDGSTPSFAASAEWTDHYRRVFAGERVTVEIEQELRGQSRCFLVSFGPIVVEGRVTGAAAFAKDISSRKRAELKLAQRAETLHYLAVVDQMTHLYNRRGFLELGQTLLRDARALGAPVAVLFVDLDGLKHINDHQGHAAGDSAICAAAEALSHSARRTDLVGRLGGDEFVVLATGMDDEGLLVERIRAQASERGLSMSIGVVREEPGEEPRPLEQLLEQADAVMYRDKTARKSARMAAL
jgi:diguanylate cyclase (GGDEF)-like protein/PAS domain S-box-containing protein